MEQSHSEKFTAYEYKEILIDKEQASFYMDAYENFGWKVDIKIPPSNSQGRVSLHFRRDRNIINKTELTRLQRNFDSCMEEVKQLEASKKSSATAVSIAVATVGTVCMAGATFAVTAATPMIGLCVILAIPGFIGWILPFFLYKHVVKKRTEKVEPLIKSKYDEAYEVCDKGFKLL